MKALSILMLLILALPFSPALGQERFPSWVPPEAAKAAKAAWLHWAELEDNDELLKKYGILREELPRSQLGDPRKVVDIDYESYQPGSDIFAMLNNENSRYRNAFGFSVCIDNSRVGSVVVSLRDQWWIMREITGAGGDPVNPYAEIYSKYPPSENLVICQKVDGAFFIVKDSKVIDVFYWNVETRDFREMDPTQYIMREKTGIENFKKSDYYKHYLEIRKQAHEDSLKIKDASLRAPLDTVPPKK